MRYHLKLRACWPFNSFRLTNRCLIYVQRSPISSNFLIPFLVVGLACTSTPSTGQTSKSDLKVEVVPGIGHSGEVYTAALSPDGRLLVSGGTDAAIKLWDVASGRVLRTLTGHSESIHAIAFSPDGQTLASASSDKTIRLWNAESGRQLATLTGHQDEVTAVAFSPDGRTIVSGGYDNTLKLWDTVSGKELRSLAGHRGPIRGRRVRARWTHDCLRRS